jgi:hypothetical protein
MPSKRYLVEQTRRQVARGRAAPGTGVDDPAACASDWGISDQTFYRWCPKYGALKGDEAQRPKALEHENAHLKRIVAEQAWTLRC